MKVMKQDLGKCILGINQIEGNKRIYRIDLWINTLDSNWMYSNGNLKPIYSKTAKDSVN